MQESDQAIIRLLQLEHQHLWDAMANLKDKLNRLEKALDELKQTESYPRSPQPPKSNVRAP